MIDDSKLDSIIDNWRRAFHRSSYVQKRMVGSVEGRFRSPQPWDAPPTPLPRIDPVSAEQTESAWRSIPSIADKLLLKWHYIYLRPRWSIVKALQKQGEKVEFFAFALKKARFSLAIAIDYRKNHDNN